MIDRQAGQRPDDREANPMQSSTAFATAVHADVRDLRPRFHITHADGTTSVALHGDRDAMNFYLCGTSDELAAFIEQLAGVVRALTVDELATTVAS